MRSSGLPDNRTFMNELLDRHQQFCDFCLGFRDLSPRTVDSYKDSLKQYLKYSNAETLKDFNRASIIGWVIYAKRERNWSPKTVHIRVGDMNAFAKWCVSEGYSEETPTANLQLPQIPHKEPDFFNEQELDSLLTVVRDYDYHDKWEVSRADAIFCMFIMTGVRKTELYNIRVSDVLFDQGMIFIQSGKNRRERYIYFNPSLRRVLEKYLVDRKKIQSTCPYFFASIEHPAGRLNDSALRRLFAKISKVYGQRVHPHKLRHSYATHMLTRNVEKHEAQRQMGQKHSKSIDVYTHVCDRSLQQKVNRFGYDCSSEQSKKAHGEYRYDDNDIAQFLAQRI